MIRSMWDQSYQIKAFRYSKLCENMAIRHTLCKVISHCLIFKFLEESYWFTEMKLADVYQMLCYCSVRLCYISVLSPCIFIQLEEIDLCKCAASCDSGSVWLNTKPCITGRLHHLIELATPFEESLKEVNPETLARNRNLSSWCESWCADFPALGPATSASPSALDYTRDCSRFYHNYVLASKFQYNVRPAYYSRFKSYVPCQVRNLSGNLWKKYCI